MIHKVKKLLEISLLGAMFLGVAPLISLAYSPYVTTGTATAITTNSATLNGSVNADNMPTSVWFEYSTDGSLKNASSATAYRFTSGSSGNLIAYASGLYPNTTYYFRAVAQNREGRAYGNIYLFTTNTYTNYSNTAEITPLPFSSTTQSASSVKSTSAQLNALVHNDQNSSSNTWFEWGTTPNLDNQTTIVSTGTLTDVKRADTLTGLSPSTTYYFRAVAENSSVRKIGVTLNFTTNKPASVSASTTKTTTTTTSTENKSLLEPTKSEIGSNLIASAIGAGSFFPVNIFGWTILVILILILMLMTKHLYRGLLNK